jgi:hypothetical protein
MTEEQN